MMTETPQEYLAKSPLTARLKATGVTDSQLQAVRFCGNNRDRPFDQWSFTFIPGTSAEAMNLTKAYCALKWLILENLPWSRDKDDAWQLVSDTIAAPIHALGLRARIARHMRDGKSMHPHIDLLTEAGTVLGASTFPGGDECDLVASLAQLPVAVEGFGSSDCRRCVSHLLRWPHTRGYLPARARMRPTRLSTSEVVFAMSERVSAP